MFEYGERKDGWFKLQVRSGFLVAFGSSLFLESDPDLKWIQIRVGLIDLYPNPDLCLKSLILKPSRPKTKQKIPTQSFISGGTIISLSVHHRGIAVSKHF